MIGLYNLAYGFGIVAVVVFVYKSIAWIVGIFIEWEECEKKKKQSALRQQMQRLIDTDNEYVVKALLMRKYKQLPQDSIEAACNYLDSRRQRAIK